MKRKRVAAAALLMTLLTPLTATPLAYAEEISPLVGNETSEAEQATPETAEEADTLEMSEAAAPVVLDSPNEVTPITWPDAAAWTYSCSKTASDLDEDYVSNIVLSLPSEEEQLVTEICFVLDKSSFSNTKEKALSLLSDLKSHADESGAKITVDIVGFNRRANDCGTFDLTTQYDEIESAFTSNLSGGTNMHAGLLMAQEKLAANTSIPDSRKYMILVSDGDTYLYCKDGDYHTPYSRSNIPFESAGDSAYGGFYANSWYYPSAPYGKNVGRPKSSSPEEWDKYLADVKNRNDESNGDQYDFVWNYYDELWKIFKNKAKAAYKEMPREERTADNMDMAFLYAAEVYKELASKYHCFSASAESLNTADGGKTTFMGYLNGGTAATFDQIQNEIAYAVGAGSRVEDVIGNDFTLDTDSLSVTVGGTELTKTAAGNNTWVFGDDEPATSRFVVAYDTEAKTLTWHINKNVSNFARVQLRYKVKLTAPKTTAGKYTVPTNESAILYPVDSNGQEGEKVEFPKPEVSYNIYTLDYDANGGSNAPAGEISRSGSFTVSDAVPARDGYKFAGWNTAADGSGTNYTAGSKIELTEEAPAMTLYAQWNKLVTVTFDLCGHGGTIASQTFVSGNKASEPATPKEDGWVFGGWYTEKGCLNRFSFDTAVTGDITLYAKWTRVDAATKPTTTPAPSPAPAATTKNVKSSAIPQTSDAFPVEGLLALLAVGAIGTGAAGYLRKKRR